MADVPMQPTDPDAVLMVAFQHGSIGAFEQLLGKYQRIIVNFIYRIVNNSAEAEELAQEVFLRIYEARESYEPRARFSSWIYRIATNVGLKAAERKRHSPFGWLEANHGGDEEASEWSPPDNRRDAEHELLDSEMSRVMRDAIRSLPRNEKTAIILRRYEDLSYREIAEVMNCTEAAVKTYIHRGKLRLRDRLLPYFENRE